MSNFDGTAAGLENIQQLWGCLTALLKDLVGDVDLTKGDLQTQVNELIKQIGTDGEIHGAIVLVSTDEENLITKTVELSKDSTVIVTNQFDSNGKCIFVNIQEPGEYVVSTSDGTDETSEIVTITSDNIVNKTVVSCEISLTPVGATVTPVDDVTVLLKCADIKNGFTTMDQVLSDSNTMYLITSNENAMQYLARSTGFADAVCANETFMTYLGQSPYVDDTVLNSDIWCSRIRNSLYMDKILSSVVPTLSSNNGCITTSSDYIEDNRYIPFNGNDIGNTGQGWLAKLNVGTAWYKYTFPSPVSIIIIKTCFVDNAVQQNLTLYPFTFTLKALDENNNEVTLYSKQLETTEFSDKWVDIVLPQIKKVKSITWDMSSYSYHYANYYGTIITRIKIYGRS